MISSRDLISRLNTRPYKLGHTIRFKIEISFFVSVFNAKSFFRQDQKQESALFDLKFFFLDSTIRPEYF